MWSRAELQAFLERQRAAQSVLLADVEAAAEFESARSSWDGTVFAAREDERLVRWDEVSPGVGGASGFAVSSASQGGR